MKQMRVWLRRERGGLAVERLVSVPDNATIEQVDEACGDVLDELVEDELDFGWEEVTKT